MVKITTIRNKKGKVVGTARLTQELNLSEPTRKAVAKIAKKVVNKAAETKYVGELYSNEPSAIYGSTVPTGGVPQIYDVCPSISQGDTEYQRTGVKIVPTKHVVDVDLTFNPANDAAECAWDVNVHVWYGYVRRYKNSQDVLANANNICVNLLDSGQGNTQAWLGRPTDHLLKVNTEWVSMKHKMVRMYRPLGTQNVATLTGGLTTYFPQTIHKTLRLTLKPPKVLQYNESSPLPENYAPVVIIGYQHNDYTQASNAFGGAPTVLTIPALQVMLKQHMWFKDV